MAREEKKPVKLRAVDDEVAPVVKVVRLENQKTAQNTKEEPVRLGRLTPNLEPSRLDVPSRDDLELRTHQPVIEVLIDSENFNLDHLEEGWGERSARKHPIPWGWFALIGLTISGAVVWALSHVREADVQADQIRVETESALAKEEREISEAHELVTRIEDSLRYFFNATTVDSLAKMVRQSERVNPLMLKYYMIHPVFRSPLSMVRVLQPLTLENRTNFWIASVVLANGQKHNLVIETEEDGNPLIDWETFVCDQPLPWDEFALERPAGTSLDFRVYVERDMFFSHEFADSDRWLCFRLTALESEETLFGYVAVDSEEAQALLNLLEANAGRKTSMILRLCIPEGLQSRRGVMIEKVISPRWMYLDPPGSPP